MPSLAPRTGLRQLGIDPKTGETYRYEMPKGSGRMVMAKICVSETGCVLMDRTKVVRSSGDKRLDARTMQAISRWVHKPFAPRVGP